MENVEYDDAGLVPGIIQHALTGRVLMLGYLNEPSLELTRTTGQVHFWSRSRSRLWKKGETSGNTLTVVDMTIDCDRDAILIRALPTGPTCHTGSTSCFGDDADQGFATLESLWATITNRIAEPVAGSYTAALAAAGVDMTTRKLVEEATETLIAAKNHAAGDTPQRVTEEAADVLYHLLVVLAERGITAATVLDELRRRAR